MEDEANRTTRCEASKIYQPLSTDHNEIRLLTLKAGSKDALIECALTSVRLNDPLRPSYTALSYTWGTSDNPKWIIIDRKCLPVTMNLHIALEHFRKPDEDSCLWIDAICVNQYDLKERGEQVLRMRDIYSQAENTIVWLGPEAENSSKAMDLIDLCDYICEDYFSKEESGASPPDENLWGPHHSWKIEDELEALSALLQRSWFFRIWVVQEAVVSTNLIICCGNRQTSWNSVSLYPVQDWMIFY